MVLYCSLAYNRELFYGRNSYGLRLFLGVYMKYLFLMYLLIDYEIIFIILAMNLISFTMFFVDKRKAIKGKNRISEKSLLLSAFLFGSVGAFLSMQIFRHKTQKLKFKILVPLFFVLQMVCIYYLYKILL